MGSSKSLGNCLRTITALVVSLGVSGCSAPTFLNIFDRLPSANRHEIQATSPSPIETDLRANVLPDTYWYQGKNRSTSDFLEKSGTAGLVVILDGKVIHEDYGYGKDQNTAFTSWSVAKSFTSALVGIAIEEGFIGSVDDLVIDYVPELSTTAYATTTIEDVLEMASGVDFDETYMLGSDVFYLQLAIAKDLGDEVLKYTESKNEPGTFNAYKSLDTQVLGMLLVNATGMTVSEYLESRIWGPAGMTQDAAWLADVDNLEATFCCLYATTRDFAKLGLIYLNNGYYNGQQIVPSQWVADSLDISEPHLQPGENPMSDYNWGYGYQWWFRDNQSDYSAVGIYNQFVYINPDVNLVIAKNSGAPNYLLNDMENEHYAVFRAIAENLAPSP